MLRRSIIAVLVGVALVLGIACTERPAPPVATPAMPSEPRRGDEIVVAGQFVHTGAPVVLRSVPDTVTDGVPALGSTDWLADASSSEIRGGSP